MGRFKAVICKLVAASGGSAAIAIMLLQLVVEILSKSQRSSSQTSTSQRPHQAVWEDDFRQF